MKKFASVVVACVAVCLSAGFATADQAEDCADLVKGAVAMFKEQGKEKALKAIDDKDGPFVKGSLYVFAITMDNIIIAHPHEKSLKRINLSNTKDSNGKKFFMEFSDLAKNKGSGWVEYMWAKPGEKEPTPKRSFVMKVPEEEIYVGAGYYLK